MSFLTSCCYYSPQTDMKHEITSQIAFMEEEQYLHSFDAYCEHHMEERKVDISSQVRAHSEHMRGELIDFLKNKNVYIYSLDGDTSPQLYLWQARQIQSIVEKIKKSIGKKFEQEGAFHVLKTTFSACKPIFTPTIVRAIKACKGVLSNYDALLSVVTEAPNFQDVVTTFMTTYMFEKNPTLSQDQELSALKALFDRERIISLLAEKYRLTELFGVHASDLGSSTSHSSLKSSEIEQPPSQLPSILKKEACSRYQYSYQGGEKS